MATPKYNWAALLLSICLCVMINLFITTTKATPTYTTTRCTNTTTYAPNSNFQTDIDTLFLHLSRGGLQFWIHAIMGKSSIMNAFFLCRGDITTTDCDQCLTAAVKEIKIQCPNQTEALIWYDECFLRFTDRYFAVDKIIPRANLDDGNIDSGINLGRFNQSLHGLLNRLATEAASYSEKKFATGEAVVTESMKLYGLMQCVNNLHKSECDKCLRDAIGTLPNGKQGARALLPSCNVRYQLHPFFNQSSSTGDKKLGRSGTIAVAVVLPVVFLIILFLCCYDFKRRSKKKRVMASLMENFEDEIPTLESLQFNLATLEAATNQFSLQNKIGSGGFGEVYKGVLLDGRQIAVKKLSKYSGQGTIEFKNEIVLIAKLQHRNLVTLYGFCSEEQEKMLVYKSDVFSFGVIILEIISSKRNARSLGSPDFNDLLSYAWKNWKDETQLEVLDSDIEKSFCHSEVIKCIQIGLLCVQQNPFDRPTMERIVWYLSSVSAELPLPQEPAGFMANGTNPSMIPRINSSVNHMTMSLTFPR